MFLIIIFRYTNKMLITDCLFDETNVPKVLCADFIPNEELSNNYSYDNECKGYDDDTSSVYDNPYYNDNLDMDQQSIDFWNNLQFFPQK